MKNNILYYAVQINYYCSPMFDLLNVIEQINICRSYRYLIYLLVPKFSYFSLLEKNLTTTGLFLYICTYKK